MSAASRLALAAPPPSGAPDDVLALTEAYNASGRQLFGEFAKKPGNIVFSPYSIGTVMAMALSGARGATEQETGAAVGVSVATVKRDWDFARTWLISQLKPATALSPAAAPHDRTPRP